MGGSAPGWRISLIVQGRSLAGALAPVEVGLVATATDQWPAIRVGGDTVLLTDRGAAEHIVHLRQVLTDKIESHVR